RVLHSFPTRRSSDLGGRVGVIDARQRFLGHELAGRAIETRRLPAEIENAVAYHHRRRVAGADLVVGPEYVSLGHVATATRAYGRDRKSTRLNSSHLG